MEFADFSEWGLSRLPDRCYSGAQHPILMSDSDHSRSGSWTARILAVFLILVVASALGGALYIKHLADERLRVNDRIEELSRQSSEWIEARRWADAATALDEIDRLRPQMEVVSSGRAAISAGLEEEQRQFVEYWTGEAETALELGRLDDAIQAAHTALEKYPGQPELTALLEKAEATRSEHTRRTLIEVAASAIRDRQWDEAEAKAAELTAAFPESAEAPGLLEEIRAGREKDARDLARARELFAAAQARDTGTFDPEAFEWLQEAIALAPGEAQIAELHAKIGALTRTIRVPEDFDDLQAAIAAARNRDRLVISEGTFKGPLVIDKVLTLEGAGRDKTIVEVEAAEGTAATFGPNSGGTTVSGIAFLHLGFDDSEERFSAILVRGAEVNFNDCRAADAAGHGLAVIEGAHVSANRCLFDHNGWDGVAIRGQASRGEFTECQATGNTGHGFDVWDGATATILRSEARENSGNGILVHTTAGSVAVGENTLRANREYGIVLYAAASGRIHANRSLENLLGGMAVRAAARGLEVVENTLEKNEGPGLFLERGLDASAYATNPATGNPAGQDIVANADFSTGD